MVTLTAPRVVTERDLYQVRTVSETEVAGIVVEAVVIKCQDLQGLQVTEGLVLDVVDLVPVEVELAEACKQGDSYKLIHHSGTIDSSGC